MKEKNQVKVGRRILKGRHNKMMLLCAIVAGITMCAIGLYGCSVQKSAPEPAPTPLATAMPTASPSPAPTPTPTPAPTPTPTPALTEEQRMVGEMQQENPDIIGFIRIPNTRVEYPVLQAEDNDYYLDKNEYKESSVDGAIFLDANNHKDFTDRNSVIYGHRMNSGAMFADLHKFADRDFFEQNPIITIFTPETVLEYEVFAAYKTDDKYLFAEWDFEDDQSWSSYLEQLGNKDENANFSGRIITGQDRVITLSTCVRYEADRRYAVQAVLLP